MIRIAGADDQDRIVALYRAVAAVPDGLARTPEEVTEAYVGAFMQRAAQDGIELVHEEEGVVLGEIHASRVGIASLAHLLTDLTIAVSPAAQGRGVGRGLFAALLREVTLNMPHIARVELFARASNVRARVNNARGEPETDTVMGWLRP